jgi:hypothetical protein
MRKSVIERRTQMIEMLTMFGAALTLAACAPEGRASAE